MKYLESHVILFKITLLSITKLARNAEVCALDSGLKTAEYKGGGIYNEHSIVPLNGSSITDNTANYNMRGWIMNLYGTLIMNSDSSITGNAAHYGCGISNYGTLTINGGSISNTTAGGGGILNDNTCGTLTIIGGSITNNIADRGGGICSGGILNTNGSRITRIKQTATVAESLILDQPQLRKAVASSLISQILRPLVAMAAGSSKILAVL